MGGKIAGGHTKLSPQAVALGVTRLVSVESGPTGSVPWV